MKSIRSINSNDSWDEFQFFKMAVDELQLLKLEIFQKKNQIINFKIIKKMQNIAWKL